MINLLILIFLLGCLLVIYRFSQTAPALALNCSSELYDRQLNEGEDAQHYLLLDLQTKGKRAWSTIATSTWMAPPPAVS